MKSMARQDERHRRVLREQVEDFNDNMCDVDEFGDQIPNPAMDPFSFLNEDDE